MCSCSPVPVLAAETVTCENCGGSGYVETVKPCETCHGVGHDETVAAKTCETCHGSGYVKAVAVCPSCSNGQVEVDPEKDKVQVEVDTTSNLSPVLDGLTALKQLGIVALAISAAGLGCMAFYDFWRSGADV